MNDATYHQGEATVCGGTDIYFPVETRPAEVDGREVPGYFAVIRSDTGQVFGFHRAEYRLVRNAELFPQFDAALLECGFDLSGMIVSDAHRLRRPAPSAATACPGSGSRSASAIRWSLNFAF